MLSEEGSFVCEHRRALRPLSVLERAIERGDVEEMSSLLASSEKKSPSEMFQLFQLAVEKNQTECAEILLIQGGFDINVCEGKSANPLVLATQQKSVQMMSIMLKNGADVNSKGSRGRTSLHFASLMKDREKFILLLEHDCDVNAKDDHGLTPLHSACSSGDNEIVEMLLLRGANIQAVGKCGRSPLHLAVLTSEKREKLIELILSQPGVDINIRDGLGQTPLMYAVSSSSVDNANTLLSHGADCNKIWTTFAYLPLHVAVNKGDTKMVELMLEKTTPEAIQEYCINSSANNNIVDLMCLASKRSPHLIPVLLRHGLILRQNYMLCQKRQEVSLYTPYYHTIQEFSFALKGDVMIAEYQYDTPLALLLGSFGKGHDIMNLVKCAIDAGAEVNPSATNATPALLHFMARRNLKTVSSQSHYDVLTMLESRGLDPDHRTSDITFIPDLLAAATLNDSRSLAFLLRISKLTPCELLHGWVYLLEHAVTNRMPIIPPYRQTFAKRMTSFLEVIFAYGQFDIKKAMVHRFQTGVKKLTGVKIEVQGYFQALAGAPSLRQICRSTYRRDFMSSMMEKGPLVKDVVLQLDIPETLKGYLLYDDVDFKKYPISF